MIDNLMIAKIVVTVLYVIVVFIVGVVCGQYSVWVYIRKKGHITLNDWCYAAVKATEGQYKRWE